jgi:hypothetical protein
MGVYAPRERLYILRSHRGAMADERLLTLGEILAGPCELSGPNGMTKLVHSPIGDLVLPTGRIVTRDPMAGSSSPALAVTVAPGSYPASLCKQVGKNDFARACLLIVRFSQEPPVKWEQAAVPGEDASKLRIGSRLAFLVDSATVGLVDESVQARLDDDATSQAIIQAFEAVVVFGVASVSFGLDPQTGATLVATKTEGDGRYGAYWGFDSSGRPVALVTDLNTLRFARPSALDAAAVQQRIKKLTVDLIDGRDEPTQLGAVRELGALGGPEARKLAQLAELKIYNGVSEAVRSEVPRVLGRLADADPLLREDYRRLILTGEPPPRLACAVAVAKNISWTEQDADVAQALRRLVEEATDARLIGELIGALPRVRHLLPDGEVQRRLEPLLQHANEGIRSRALRQLTHEFCEISNDQRRPPSSEERQRLLTWADSATADSSVAVRLAASGALRRLVSLQPAHHGRLLRVLRDPAPEVALEMATFLADKRAEWAEDAFAPVLQCIARLERDASLSEAARAKVRRSQERCSKRLAPPLPSARPLFGAGPVELRSIPPEDCG